MIFTTALPNLTNLLGMSKKDTALCLRFKLCGDLESQWNNESVLLLALKKDKELWSSHPQSVSNGTVEWNDETFNFHKKASMLGTSTFSGRV